MTDVAHVVYVGEGTLLPPDDEGFTVRTVADPADVYPELETAEVDCVVCDARVDWTTLDAGLDDRFSDVPFLVYGEATPERIERTDETGVDALLPRGASDAYAAARIREAVASGDQRETELKHSDARFYALTESINAGIVTVDTDGIVQFANRGIESVLGWDPGELEGGPVSRLVPERFVQQHHDGIERYLDTGEREINWAGTQFPAVSETGDEVPVTLSLGEFEHDGDRYLSAIISEQPDGINVDRLREELTATREALASLPDEVDSATAAAALRRARDLLDE
jgi:PAS domain S-box-containing protein